jgi:Family of unknown function (DUF6152)
MRNSGLSFASVIFGALLFGGSTGAMAHHSFAQFDSSRSVMLEGTVTKFEWTNPHSWIYLNVSGAGSVTEEWQIELPAAAALAREGWSKTFVKPGEKIAVRVNPLKDGRKAGLLQSFTPGE